MTLFATKHACTALKKNFEARNLKKLIDEVWMLHCYALLLIHLLHVIAFKLQENETCDMKRLKIKQKSNRNGSHVVLCFVTLTMNSTAFQPIE